MSRKLTENDLENMSQSKHLCTLEADIIDKGTFGDKKKHRMHFEVYDGLAYCENYKGKEYISEFPKQSFVKTDCKEMADSVVEFNGLQNSSEITAVHIMKTYGTIQHIV